MFGKLLYHNFILVHRAGHLVRQRFTPAGLLVLSGLIASATFGLDTRQTLSYQIFTLSGSLLLASFIAILFLRGRYELKRSLPDYGTQGQDFEYTLSVRNTGKAAQKDLLLFDELDPTYPDYPEFKNTRDSNDRYRNIFDRWIGYPRLLTALQKKRGASLMPVDMEVLPAGAILEKKVAIHPVRRGYLYFRQTKIAQADPLGLFRSVRKHTHHDRLLILPRRYRLPPVILPGRRRYQHGGMNLATSVGDSQEFFSLRDYRPRDPLRAIHWRSYAKKGEPVVKEQQDEYFSRQGLVFDTFLDNRAELLLEEAVAVAASLAVAKRDQDTLLDLLLIGHQACRFTAGRGIASTENLLEILACVSACRTASFHALAQLVLQHAAASSGYICIFLDWDSQRRQLVRQLLELQLPVQVIVIAQAGEIKLTDQDDPMSAQPQFFWILEAGNIQFSVDRMTRRP
ncbi:MAG: DUF58 domain-containing protein [Gammaproteobacteria bacterium]